jgi:hypothetical protein
MFDQRQQQFSTILLSGTIMLGNLVCDLVQGKFVPWEWCLTDECSNSTNPKTDTYAVLMYAVVKSLSLGLLSISILLCVEVLWHTKAFMARKSQTRTRRLGEAIETSKLVLAGIREGIHGDTSSRRELSCSCARCVAEYNTVLDARADAVPVPAPVEIPPYSAQVPEPAPRNITRLTEEEVAARFQKFEPRQARALQMSQDEIIRVFDFEENDRANAPSRPSQSFDEYWERECELYASCAIYTLYAGSFFMFYSYITWMWVTYQYTYQQEYGAKVASLTMLILLMVALVVLIVMRFEQLNEQHDQQYAIDHRIEHDDDRGAPLHTQMLQSTRELVRTASAGLLRWVSGEGAPPPSSSLFSRDSAADLAALGDTAPDGRVGRPRVSFTAAAMGGGTRRDPPEGGHLLNLTRQISHEGAVGAGGAGADGLVGAPWVARPAEGSLQPSPTTPLASHVVAPSRVSINLVTPAHGSPIPPTPVPHL